MPDQLPTNLPYTSNQLTDTEIASVGGNVRKFTAEATLLIGDVVYISAAKSVNKAAANANYATFAGVVVGGKTFSDLGAVATDDAEVGATAAAADEWVLVQITGIAFIKSNGAILAGSRVIPDTVVAGECTVAGADPGYTLGTALVAIPDGSVGEMLIGASYNEV